MIHRIEKPIEDSISVNAERLHPIRAFDEDGDDVDGDSDVRTDAQHQRQDSCMRVLIAPS